MKTIVLLAIAGFIVKGCKNNNAGTDHYQSSELSENTIVLSIKQIKTANILTGEITKQLMSETVECSGTIEVPSNSVALVSAPLGGFIKSAPYYPGNYVNKGTKLAVLEHSEYIRLQQEYLETKSQLEYFKEEFKRQGELTVENASSIKKMQQAQADYRVAEIKLLSLAAQLKLIGFNPDSLYIEGIKTTIDITTPISGNISKVNASIGKYSAPGEMIYEIVNNNNTHLHLNIFEKDIHKLKKGQKLLFWLANDSSGKYSGSINSIGQIADQETSFFGVYAYMLQGSLVFKPGMHIYAEISVTSDSVYAVPNDALVVSAGKEYIFQVADTIFTRIPVEKGMKNNSYTEIIKLVPELINRKIVIAGAYYLNAEIEKEE